MNEAEYHKFFQYEESFWWFTGMRTILFGLLSRRLKNRGRGLAYLDVGCGTGGALTYFTRGLERMGVSVTSFGIDFHPLAVRYCKSRGLSRIAQASATDIPFRDGQFDVVVCFDVLQHILDDRAAVREIHRVLRNGGILLINEVAFNFLMDENSIAAHVVRRYTRRELVEKLKSAGFKIVRATYADSILFLPTAIVRLIKRWLRPPETMDRSRAVTCVRPYPRLVNTFLHYLLVLEKNALHLVNFPFGVSVIVMAKK